MKLADLLEEFNVVIDTSEGLTELRSLILGLAVRGKLVPQDPTDEPASELLKKIEAEKNTFYEENNVRVPKIDPLSEKDSNKRKPDQWGIVRLFDLYDFEYGKSLPKKKRNDNGEIPVFGSNGVIGNHDESLINRPAIIIGRKGSVGALNICREPFWPTDVTYYVCPYAEMSIEFSYYHLLSLELEELGKGIKPGLTRNEAYDLVTLLPPLAEQHRIVQKIESLFAEVDELEAKFKRQAKLDEKLQMAVNAEVQQAPDAEASKTAWSFITSNFDTLYHTPEAINNLKKNILNEAVRGRLVRQNPNDEPASELLKKIEAEKERLYEEGEIRKPKDLPPVKEDEVPFEIPESWEWVRLGNCSFNLDAKRVPLSRADRENRQGKYPYYGASGIIDHIDDYIFEDDLLLIGEDGANLINRSTPIAFIASGKYWVNNHAHVLDAIDIKLLKWLEAYVNSINLEPYVTGTAQPKLNQTRLNKILVALPPLEEQHRIVRRIKELFAICDRFKAQMKQRQVVNERLIKGLVNDVLEGS